MWSFLALPYHPVLRLSSQGESWTQVLPGKSWDSAFNPTHSGTWLLAVLAPALGGSDSRTCMLRAELYNITGWIGASCLLPRIMVPEPLPLRPVSFTEPLSLWPSLILMAVSLWCLLYCNHHGYHFMPLWPPVVCGQLYDWFLCTTCISWVCPIFRSSGPKETGPCDIAIPLATRLGSCFQR